MTPSCNETNPYNDMLEILAQSRSRTTNAEQFYREIIYALSTRVTLEEFLTICDAAANTTAESRSLHED